VPQGIESSRLNLSLRHHRQLYSPAEPLALGRASCFIKPAAFNRSISSLRFLSRYHWLTHGASTARKIRVGHSIISSIDVEEGRAGYDLGSLTVSEYTLLRWNHFFRNLKLPYLGGIGA
jgi:hypothetical protein